MIIFISNLVYQHIFNSLIILDMIVIFQQTSKINLNVISWLPDMQKCSHCGDETRSLVLQIADVDSSFPLVEDIPNTLKVCIYI